MKGRIARKSGGSAYENGPESSNEEGVKVTDNDKGADWYSGDTSNVKKEAEEKTGFKKGGKVGKKQGYYDRGHEAGGMHEFEKLKKEKKVAKKDGGCAMGDKSKSRLDRPKRASGGAISGSRSPFAMSERTSERPGFKGMTDIAD